MNAVERFLIVDEIYIQLAVPLSTLLKYVPQYENIVRTSTPLANTRLLVPQEVINSLGDALSNDTHFFGILIITLLCQLLSSP